MKYKILLILGFVLITSNSVSAQTAKKTITNADLEKYRVQREKAEADYRANYERRGMPSPEELQKREAEDHLKREELARRLAAERLQEEQTRAIREQTEAENARRAYQNNSNMNPAEQYYSNSPLILGNPYYGDRWRHRRNFPPAGGRFGRRIRNNRPDIVAGGGMVYSVPRSAASPRTSRIGGGRFPRR